MPGKLHINIRVSDEDKMLISLGAQAWKMSVTAFMLKAATHAARNALAQTPESSTQSYDK